MALFSVISRACIVVAACLVASEGTNASPLVDPHDHAGSLASRATQAAPHWVIYSDKWVSGENGPPAVNEITVCFDGILHTFNENFPRSGKQGLQCLVSHALFSISPG